MQALLDSIQSISTEARRALADPEMSREELLRALGVRPKFRFFFQDLWLTADVVRVASPSSMKTMPISGHSESRTRSSRQYALKPGSRMVLAPN